MSDSFTSRRYMGPLLLSAWLAASSVPAYAEEVHRFEVARGEASDAIRDFGTQAGLQILAAGDRLQGRELNAVSGELSTERALQSLLVGSGLTHQYVGERSVALVEAPAESREEVEEVLVTGSHIRGAPSTSTTITVSQEEMIKAGFSSLGDVVRSLPQNFGGGQNPGVGVGVPERLGSNVGGGSALNLRGIGQDATLTLLNGHRLAYNSAFQGVDISTIPMVAVERIEIVADGSSALYGSDAVGGVANVILKRDYDGVSATARYGATTDGGGEQYQYSMAMGTTWDSGGVIAAYDFEQDDPIEARDRSYTRELYPDSTVYPPLKHQNVVISGHQALTSALTLSADAVYHKRSSDPIDVPFTTTSDYHESGSIGRDGSEFFSISPTLKWQLADNADVSLIATYAEDNTDYSSEVYFQQILAGTVDGIYDNRAVSAELNSTGQLFSLPAGPVRYAVGGGLRSNDFESARVGSQTVSVTQDVHYGFGEVSVPLIAPEQGVAGVRRLDLSGSVRYEDYRDIDEVLTPRVGLLYSPVAAVDIKASWGKSFKAPQFYQQYNGQYTYLRTGAAVGGTGFPAGSTVLYTTGSNPDLQPERAETRAVGVVFRPLVGAELEVSYFDIDYTDRVVTPITSAATAMSLPIYQQFIDLNPSPADIDAVIASSMAIFNSTSAPLDPSAIVAIVNGVSTNAATQSIHGWDIAGRYRYELAERGALRLQVSASFLDSEQQLLVGQSAQQMSGAIFNPPRWRVRAGAAWEMGRLSLSSYVNYIDGVEDTRYTPRPQVSSMTTVDATGNYLFADLPGLLRNLELTLTVQNLFNAKPDRIRQVFEYDTPYDSTNYSPFGRFISLAVTKHW